MSGADNTEHALAQRMRICNQRGLHARASARFVHTAELFDAEISVTRDGMTVGGTSIMGLMMLAAGPGSSILVKAKGRQAREALDAISNLIGCGFDEDTESGGSEDL
ncbi:MAG TPA: HPr family phosphocarrier protein [Devosia sp.]|nr:HPr family phosphocarrier protein [Devosia sp.]